MQITVQITGYFDWVPAAPEDEPTEAEILRMDYKQDAGGDWLKKVLIDEATETQISIPESQITTLLEHFERVGTPKTREQTYAWFIEEKIMPHHAPMPLWTYMLVQSEPETEAFLNQRFGLTGPAVIAAVPDVEPIEELVEEQVDQ